ncbi:MAG: hypothetical protein LBG43_00350 [Treponema sp.]|jgi:hypothetical protein|nr:hypothetical protein [Treponema sp.]
MRVTRKGILPDSRPDWSKRIDALRLYISDLELCLNAANRRVRELADENELLRRNADCPYSWLARPGEEAKEVPGV